MERSKRPFFAFIDERGMVVVMVVWGRLWGLGDGKVFVVRVVMEGCWMRLFSCFVFVAVFVLCTTGLGFCCRFLCHDTGSGLAFAVIFVSGFVWVFFHNFICDGFVPPSWR